MGFGFSLGMIFIILPLTLLLFIIWFISKKNIFGYALFGVWGFVILLVIISVVIRPFIEKKILDKKDFYGEYIIDRNFYKGMQADWQYNHFRFKITQDDSLFFYVTNNEDIIKTYKGTVRTVKPYKSERLKIKMGKPTHQILSYNPSIYREIWDFYLVFKSPLYFNMFFRKGKWEKINEE